MKPELKPLLEHYNTLRKTLGDAAGHWPAMAAGCVAISSETATSYEALVKKLNGVMKPSGDIAAPGWIGWWQTTDAIATSYTSEWPGMPFTVTPPSTKLLDAEWVSGSSSLQVRHMGGQWRETTLTESASGSNNTADAGLRFDITTLGRAGYAVTLTHRVYVAWDTQRAQMVPYAARLRGMQMPERLVGPHA